ncbi:hypothetical protein B5X24_HaOG214609 [Helicoverpa armigera]|nr:hypothetical protein B5X24_HaOG214609 [Helicoverpa armigera]
MYLLVWAAILVLVTLAVEKRFSWLESILKTKNAASENGDLKKNDLDNRLFDLEEKLSSKEDKDDQM